MTQAQQVQASQVSNWPYVDNVAFWKEDKTSMKIVKFITGVVIVPLAFLMNLISKAVNYVWPKPNVQPQPASTKQGWKAWASDKAQGALDGCKNIWANHKLGLGITAATIVTGGLVWKFGLLSAPLAWGCNKLGSWCKPADNPAPAAPAGAGK